MNIKAVIKLREINRAGFCDIKFRITHKRKSRYISSKIFVKPSEFDNMRGVVKPNNPNHQYLNIEIQKKIIEFQRKILEFGNIEIVDINFLINLLSFDKKNYSFFSELDNYIEILQKRGSKRTAELYLATRKKIISFTKTELLDFKNIDYKFLTQFQEFEYRKGNSVNATSIHLRNIRTIFNRSIDMGYISLDLYPFRRFKIKKETTIKRNLTIHQIRKLLNCELSGKLELARDYFLLSIYLIGINLTDIYNLTDFKNDRIIYRRAKTKKIYDVKVYAEAKFLIEKYSGEKALLNYADIYANSDNFKKAMNKFLKRVAENCKIPEPISTYYARHTWATLASDLEISKDIIAHALGHGNNSVTDIYIDFDLKKVDEANRKVINYIHNLD